MGQPFLTLENVHKSYHPPAGPVDVLRGIDLQVGPREAIAITGPSGSGKSTLLNLIAGLHRVDQGHIDLDGMRLTELSPDNLETVRAQSIGIVFQHHHLLMSCTALENVLLPTLPLGTDPDKAFQRARGLLEQVGLADRADHFPAQLSGGEQHRVAIARALINSPTLILADEPTGSLEPTRGGDIVKLLTQNRTYALITVTHTDYVAQAMDRCFALDRGKLVQIRS
jgi:ABC-type lipoprotein export system ATPase subunit